jgi:hypothetical protein
VLAKGIQYAVYESWSLRIGVGRRNARETEGSDYAKIYNLVRLLHSCC